MVRLFVGVLIFIGIIVAGSLTIISLDALDRLWERRRKRKAKRRVDPLRLDGRPLVDCPGDVWHGLPYAPGVGPEPDPVEQAFADTAIVRIAPDAPDDDELPPVDEVDVQKLVFDIYREQTRARFKGIYGEDGQA